MTDKVKKSIEELKELYGILGRCPKVSEYDSFRKEGLARRNLEKNIKMKYNDICKEHLPNVKLNIEHHVTKEYLLDLLFKLKEELNRTPKFIEFQKYSGHTYKVIVRAFGKTYNEVIEDLGWKVYKKSTTKISNDIMLKNFENLYNKLGRLPTTREVEENDDTSSTSTYLRKFGGIENICDILKLNYNNQKIAVGVGDGCLDKKGEACRSKVEMLLSNYFIDNNIKYEKETKYKNVIEGLKSNMKFDFKIYVNDKVYYIEYFGLYIRKPKTSMHKSYFAKTRKKIKLLYKNNKTDKCIFIFPNDIKNKNLDEIFKPYV